MLEIKNEAATYLSFLAAVAMVGALPACSSAEESKPQDSFAQGSGELVATLTTVPNDVHCLQLQTSVWNLSQLNFDVTPGTTQTVRVGPLPAGTVFVSGIAYSKTCAEAFYEYQSWTADQVQATVETGRVTPLTLTFKRLGRVDISIDFEECDSTDGGLPGTPDDADGGASRIWRTQ